MPLITQEGIYPNCKSTVRTVFVGGSSKSRLEEELQRAGIKLNESAETLLASDKFTVAPVRQPLLTVELAVQDLGYTQGATIAEICARPQSFGLSLAPLELGPHFRLQYLDQPEGFVGHPMTQCRAPPGSITLASAPLSDDEQFPRGFYLRRIEGTLWLRGYRSSPDHLWNAHDRFLFVQA